MNDRFRVSRTLLCRLEECGLAPAAVFQAAGLAPDWLDRDKILVTTEQLFALFRAIADSSDDPALGLKLGTVFQTERMEPLAIAALCARSLRDAVDRRTRTRSRSSRSSRPRRGRTTELRRSRSRRRPRLGVADTFAPDR